MSAHLCSPFQESNKKTHALSFHDGYKIPIEIYRLFSIKWPQKLEEKSTLFLQLD